VKLDLICFLRDMYKSKMGIALFSQKFFQMIAKIYMVLMLQVNVNILEKHLHACLQVSFTITYFCNFTFFSFVD